MKLESIAVLGTGKVGTLVATLLHESGFSVTAIDQAPRQNLPFATKTVDVSQAASLNKALSGHDAVVSCLPFHLNLPVAKLAHETGMHYFNLTEDVSTTRAIRIMGENAKAVMAPQCGLAPGFIGVVGASLAEGLERARSIELRVGALPQHPRGLLGYAFNWSAEGVVNEYLNDCEVIMDGQRKMVPAMEQLETIFIQGNKLEAFTTSGGLGTMCETFEGKVQHLNYKTMRYPGHCELMKFFFHELHMGESRTQAGQILVNAKPPVNDDVVYVHAAVEGWRGGALVREEFVRAYTPMVIGGKEWRAISWTTAASVCAVIEMVRDGKLPAKGFIKQEEIRLDAFLATRTGRLYEAGGHV